jgi:hypothetical protein
LPEKCPLVRAVHERKGQVAEATAPRGGSKAAREKREAKAIEKVTAKEDAKEGKEA